MPKKLLTYREIAERTGATPSYIHRILGGYRKPSPTMALKLEQATKVSFKEWLYPEHGKNPYVQGGIKNG